MSRDIENQIIEREAIQQYADWYSRQGYQVSVEPSPTELPEFLRTLAPDLIARREGENIVVEIKTSSPASMDQVRLLARALEHRVGWKLQVVYADLADPEWAPPQQLPKKADLLRRLEAMRSPDEADDGTILQYLLLWAIIEAAARHKLATVKVDPTRRIASSALIKMLLTEGIIEEDRYTVLRRGLSVRNSIAHGFLNQPLDASLFREVSAAAQALLGARPKQD